MCVGGGVQQLEGGGAVQVGKGVRFRVGTGVRVGVAIRVRAYMQVKIRRTGREVERKRKKSEENTRKGQNVFIRFKIEKNKKIKTSQKFFYWLENFTDTGWKILNWLQKISNQKKFLATTYIIQ